MNLCNMMTRAVMSTLLLPHRKDFTNTGLKIFSSAFGLSTLGTVAPESATKKSYSTFIEDPLSCSSSVTFSLVL